MLAESRLNELLMQWEQLRRQGETVAVEELCSDSPELIDELQRRIQARQAMRPDLDVTPSVDGSATATADSPSSTGPPSAERSEWPVIPGYHVLNKLGEGGMGVVYQVRNLGIGRVEALKMIKAFAALHPQVVQRFQMEIRAMAELQHARIVRIYAAGQHDGQPYFTMEYVPSGNLVQHMQRFAGTPESAVALMVKVARAVHYLHTKNIVHRDLKPGNILLKPDDDPLVSDFGLAKLFDPENDPENEPAGADDAGADPRLTQAGAVVGTPSYMSPEQAAGQTDKLTAASDVWAIGVILYELLTGHRPFPGVDSESVREAVRSAEPLRPRHYRPKLDANVEAICLRCLQKDPRSRYADADALGDDLERWQRGEPILPERWQQRLWRGMRRRPTLSVAASLFFVFAVVLAVLWPRHRVAEPVDKTAAAEAKAEANLQTVLADLESRQRVTLIPEVGPPRAYRWATRSIHASLSEDPDKPLSIQADGYALLELLPPHTLSRYRLRLEAHHNAGQQGGIGVYLGYSKQTSAEGLPIHCFCGIDFHDLSAFPYKGPARPAKDKDPPQPAQAGPPVDERVDMYVRLHLLYPKAPGQAPNAVRRMGVGVSTSFPPAGSPRREVWRPLQIDVEPDEVRVTWDQKPLPSLRRDKLPFFARQIVADSPKQPQEAPQFLPQEALGVYVFRGSAWFRSCTIETLPQPQPD